MRTDARPTAVRPPATPLVRHWQTILVAGYALTAFSWTLPAGVFPPKSILDPVTMPVMRAFGLWQSWEMFAPDPRREDIRVEVRFVNRAGDGHALMLTAMESMGYGERVQRERWRKFFNDHLRLDDERRLWQPFAEFMVRSLRQEGQDPASIELVRWWRAANPQFGPDTRPDVRRTPWNSHVFHRWTVPPEFGR
jgi:hypothetical protein